MRAGHNLPRHCHGPAAEPAAPAGGGAHALLPHQTGCAPKRAPVTPLSSRCDSKLLVCQQGRGRSTARSGGSRLAHGWWDQHGRKPEEQYPPCLAGALRVPCGCLAGEAQLRTVGHQSMSGKVSTPSCHPCLLQACQWWGISACRGSLEGGNFLPAKALGLTPNTILRTLISPSYRLASGGRYPRAGVPGGQQDFPS